MKKIFIIITVIIFSLLSLLSFLKIQAQENKDFPNIDNNYHIYNSISYADISNNRAIQAIYNGDINLLTPELTLFELAILNKNELKLLRNLIFAKYNYKFRSNDLLEHFKQFNWYKSERENIDTLLTQDDLKCIQKIKSFENPTNIDSNDIKLNTKLIGIWLSFPVMPSGIPEKFIFFIDNKFEYHTSTMDCGTRLNSMKGIWKVDKGFLLLTVKEKSIKIGGYITPAYGSCASNIALNETHQALLTLTKPEIYTIPLSAEIKNSTDYFPKRLFGCWYFWRWTTNPLNTSLK
ncbi:MAG TPA: YARHG domain-containing protein [Spirochaetota bacterium]|nr:YARHG domain-containing protein [Spirochaetota bacterium]HRR61007.1 YARHG domain-containing protein [Spirochaetota bacterium]